MINIVEKLEFFIVRYKNFLYTLMFSTYIQHLKKMVIVTEFTDLSENIMS